MAKFKISNPQHPQAVSLTLDSEDRRFYSLVIDVTGGGMTESDTALAMRTRHELLALKPGEKMTLSFDYINLQMQRCRGCAVFQKLGG